MISVFCRNEVSSQLTHTTLPSLLQDSRLDLVSKNTKSTRVECYGELRGNKSSSRHGNKDCSSTTTTYTQHTPHRVRSQLEPVRNKETVASYELNDGKQKICPLDESSLDELEFSPTLHRQLVGSRFIDANYVILF